jgi:hypothetical protein
MVESGPGTQFDPREPDRVMGVQAGAEMPAGVQFGTAHSPGSLMRKES